MSGAVPLFCPYAFMSWPGETLPSLRLLFKFYFLLLYRMMQEEGSVFWEVIVLVVVGKIVPNAEWLPRWSFLNLQIQMHCEC
jgi:hypothetical protein